MTKQLYLTPMRAFLDISLLLETIIIISTVSGGYLEKALFLLCLSQMKLFSSLITVVSLSIFFPLATRFTIKKLST